MQGKVELVLISSWRSSVFRAGGGMFPWILYNPAEMVVGCTTVYLMTFLYTPSMSHYPQHLDSLNRDKYRFRLSLSQIFLQKDLGVEHDLECYK